MDKNLTVTYQYEKHFANKDTALKVATSFHEKLRGNDDYIHSRILLNVTDAKVFLAEFSDSSSHVKVEEEPGRLPTLKFVD